MLPVRKENTVRRNASSRCLNQGRFKLKFQVKGQEYFLGFSEDEGQSYVFTPTMKGLQRIPVYVDAVKYGRNVQDQAWLSS